MFFGIEGMESFLEDFRRQGGRGSMRKLVTMKRCIPRRKDVSLFEKKKIQRRLRTSGGRGLVVGSMIKTWRGMEDKLLKRKGKKLRGEDRTGLLRRS